MQADDDVPAGWYRGAKRDSEELGAASGGEQHPGGGDGHQKVASLGAEEIGVSLPDPSVLNRGLHRLVRKVLEGNRDLSFKISLAKSQLQSQLQVDTVPTHSTVGVYCEHLLSELEQLVHTEKKVSPGEARAKKIEGTYAEDKTNGKEETTKEKKPCRFFLTDMGCRRGSQCTFGHDARDGRARCYGCGAVNHYAKDCEEGRQGLQEGCEAVVSKGRED